MNDLIINIISPTKAKVTAIDSETAIALKSELTIKNKSVEYEIKNHLAKSYWRSRNPHSWSLELERLKNKLNMRLFFEEEDSLNFYIRPGYIPYLEKKFKIEIHSHVNYPKPRPLPWYRPIPVELYPYQKEAIEKLMQVKHGSVELFTGAGKSYIILSLAKKFGLETIVTTPSISIFEELLKLFKDHLGPNTIGALGGGKKNIKNKKIIIAVADSLTNINADSEEYKILSKYNVLICDESHTLPATTLEKMCHGILGNIPYRFFVSGTQTRNDGTIKLLHSIIGKTVMSIPTSEGVDKGYICFHEFKIVRVNTTAKEHSGHTSRANNPIDLKRTHFLYNKNIANFIASLIRIASKNQERVLVLVDEILQIDILKPLLGNLKIAIATGDKSNGSAVEAVERFNKGEVDALIGTACIATGTNIYPTHHTVNWQGGSSEIKTKQGAVGRSVRILEKSKYAQFHKKKEKAIIWDFDVVDAPSIRYQLLNRIEFYKDSGTPINWI